MSRCTRQRPHYCFSEFNVSPAAAAGERWRSAATDSEKKDVVPQNLQRGSAMKRSLAALVFLLGTAAPSRAYIDSSLTLGKLTADANNIVVLRVDSVSQEKQV